MSENRVRMMCPVCGASPNFQGGPVSVHFMETPDCGPAVHFRLQCAADGCGREFDLVVKGADSRGVTIEMHHLSDPG